MADLSGITVPQNVDRLQMSTEMDHTLPQSHPK